ncbi:MAG: hypothetical protein WHT81_07505, partial [Rectinemataceae bacterium]
MKASMLRTAAAAIRDIMVANKDYLTALDQQNGDGDLGITMVQGYSALAQMLEQETEQDQNCQLHQAANYGHDFCHAQDRVERDGNRGIPLVVEGQ